MLRRCLNKPGRFHGVLRFRAASFVRRPGYLKNSGVVPEFSRRDGPTPPFSTSPLKHSLLSIHVVVLVLTRFSTIHFRQGEVSQDDFWEGLQSLGLGQDLSRSDVSRVVESFQASVPREMAMAINRCQRRGCEPSQQTWWGRHIRGQPKIHSLPAHIILTFTSKCNT